jgi:hypothetical protein
MFSRIAHTFNLPDYEPLDLARIFEKFLKQHGWRAMVRTKDIAGVFARVPKRLLEQTNGMRTCWTRPTTCAPESRTLHSLVCHIN